MLNRQIILDTLTSHQTELYKFGVQRIGVFGSYNRNEATDHSDIDFLVDFFKEKKNLKNLVELAEYLETIFNKKVEIVTKEGLSKYIGPHILKEINYAPFHN